MRFAPAAALLLVIAVSGCGDADVAPVEEREQQAPTSSRAGLTCMPRPSACGFPDATNTGVPPGTALTRVDGAVTLSTPGEVYSGREVHGEITIAADNVTIEKTRVISGADYPIRTFGPGDPTGTVIRDVEIDMQGQEEGKGIAFSNYTADRVWFHNGLDCAHASENVTITNSFCDLPKLAAGSQAHADGFQSDGGGDLVFRHNTIRNPNDQTSAILMSTNTSPIDHVEIVENLMSGGGYTVYCGTDEGGVATRSSYIGNVISREFFPRGGYFGATTWCDRVDTARGNVWDGNYTPPPAGGTPTPPPGGGAGSPPPGSQAPAASLKGLSMAQARRLARKILARRLGRRYKQRRGLRVRCRRRTATIRCSARWRSSPRAARRARYSGTIELKAASGGKWRYTLRIRRRSGGRSKLIRRTGRI
jgi:hypothetical protein